MRNGIAMGIIPWLGKPWNQKFNFWFLHHTCFGTYHRSLFEKPRLGLNPPLQLPQIGQLLIAHLGCIFHHISSTLKWTNEFLCDQPMDRLCWKFWSIPMAWTSQPSRSRACYVDRSLESWLREIPKWSNISGELKRWSSIPITSDPLLFRINHYESTINGYTMWSFAQISG